MSERIVIIGAGQAGSQVAASLRAAGFGGDLTILGDEPSPPYQRPPLSKAYLQGELEIGRLFLRPDAFFEKERIDLRLGVRAVAIDRAERIVTASDGQGYPYDKLCIATGAPARRINVPGAQFDGVHYLRTIADSDALRPVLARPDRRIAIVGAGYIGLEVAASARKAGLEVVVIEMEDRVLARVAGAEISAFFERVHREAGVEFLFGEAVSGIEGGPEVKAVALASGRSIRCDAVLVGIGAVPQIELAEAAGLKIENGIWTDDGARTSDHAIWAAGDCASHPSVIYGRRLRLESVPNAIEQAKVAGANMAGGSAVYDAVPWFWSDQYDVKLQTVGLSAGADLVIVRGEPEARKFSVWSLSEGRVLSVDAINDPGAFVVAKKLIAARATADAKKLADPAVDLKSLL